jgi:hypothetical protein
MTGRHLRNRIGDRDSWICGYCRTAIDPAIRWPHPLSPSIGHIRWVAFDGDDQPENLRIEHLACNTKNIPPMLVSVPGHAAQRRREAAGLPPYTDQEWKQERQLLLESLLANPPEPLPLAEAVRRHWHPGMDSWTRWHAENPGICDCEEGNPSSFCLPSITPQGEGSAGG